MNYFLLFAENPLFKKKVTAVLATYKRVVMSKWIHVPYPF